jgi:hypothetical protein
MMTFTTLRYSRKKLARSGLLATFLGLTCMALWFKLTGEEGHGQLREAALLYIFGPYGPRIFVTVGGGLFVLGGLAALRRLLGDGTAVAIRPDGIKFATIFSSGIIPWRSLDGVYVHATRWGEKTFYSLNSRSRRAAGEGRLLYWFTRRFTIPVTQLEAGPAEVAAWIDAAEKARAQALLLPQRNQPAAMAGFGRRAA